MIYGLGGDDAVDGGTGVGYINAGPDADTCTRGDTVSGCENRTGTP